MTTREQVRHTPGPWQVHAKEIVTDSMGHAVCATESDYRTVEEEEANARLIAAAPEMGAKLLELWNAGILADNETHALLTKAGLI